MHDTTTWPAPGAIIGYLKSGRPVRLQAGGSETATETPPAAPAAPQPAQPPAPAAPAAPAPPPPAPAAPAAAPAQPPAPAAPADGTDWRAEAEKARAEATRLKAEADQWKAQSRRQETRSKQNHEELKNRDAVLRQVAEKIGIDFDDKPDPEVLQQRLDAQTSLARQRAVELAVYTQAAASGANAPALLDSRGFMDRTAQLDPDAADFPAQVAELVRAAATDARYQLAPPPAPAAAPAAPAAAAPGQQPPPAEPPAPASGAQFGAPAGDGMWTQADYDAYMATSSVHDRDGAKLMKAISEGRLVNLGIGRPKRR